jgi:uncharacterized membrane protein YqaE (UPF0057 family)
MKTLCAFFLPPLAVLLTGRPMSAVLNVFLTIFGLGVLGIAHALWVLHSDTAERRHAEMLSAVSGKKITPRASGEQQLFAALAVVAAIVLCFGAVFVFAKQLIPGLDIRSLDEIQAEISRAKGKPTSAPAPVIEAVKPSVDLPAAGTTFAEVTAQHGEPATKDKASGWAEWRAFRARFENGRVSAVEAKP